MAFPEQERFTTEDLAKRWSRTVNEIDELLRTMQFSHIILTGEVVGGASLTRHLYFDLNAWVRRYGKELASACETHRKDLNDLIKRYEEERKQKGLRKV